MIAFTICSNNYLSEALTLGDSLKANGLAKNNFFIFLCDKKKIEINYEDLIFKVIEITDAIVPGFTELTQRYQLVELNTSVKPSLFKYLFKSFNENIFAYLDPDLFFYKNIEIVVKELGDSSVLLTPHILNSVTLDSHPSESVFLNYGLYNLGFLMLRKDYIANQILDWWEERTLKIGYDNPSKGLFVDQLWMNLTPIYFENVKISRHIGLNTAYWNLTERSISSKNDYYFLNETEELVFFHFSSFDHSMKELSKRGSTIDPNQWEIILEMMSKYKTHLNANSFEFYKGFIPSYKISFENYLERYLPEKKISSLNLKILKILGKILPRFFLVKITNFYHKLIVIEEYNQVL